MIARLDVDHHHLAVFERDDELASARHEQVAFCRDDATGLRAIIALHSTARGPALGGTRFFAYGSEAEALTDVLRLSEGMTSKSAAADLPLGGGKAVILGDPNQIKTPELLGAFGRFVESLGGRYITAADVGTTAEDMDVVGARTRHVVGRTRQAGGSGDSGYATALGVFHAMETAAKVRWGSSGLQGRSVGVEGAGKVGIHLIRLVLEAGGSVFLCDRSEPALHRATGAHPEIVTVDSVIDRDLDVYAPCALGGTLDHRTVTALRAGVVCGAANNQLITRDIADLMRQREILWVPDYIANAGGLIQVAAELDDRPLVEALSDVRTKISDTVATVLVDADRLDVSTSRAAQMVVEERVRVSRTQAAPSERQ